MRRWQPCGLAAWVLLAGCQEPTQITLEVTTDVQCPSFTEAWIYAAEPGLLSQKDASAVASECSAPRVTGEDNYIGSLALVPSGDDGDPLSIQVVAGLGVSVQSCDANPAQCIVARRSLSFITNKPLTLPIVLREACAGVQCDEEQTCVQGVCVDAQIEPETCLESGGCGEDIFPVTEPNDDLHRVSVATAGAGRARVAVRASGEYPVVYEDRGAGTVVYARITAEGTLFGGVESLGSAAASGGFPSVAVVPNPGESGGEVMLAWMGDDGGHVELRNAAGTAPAVAASNLPDATGAAVGSSPDGAVGALGTNAGTQWVTLATTSSFATSDPEGDAGVRRGIATVPWDAEQVVAYWGETGAPDSFSLQTFAHGEGTAAPHATDVLSLGATPAAPSLASGPSLAMAYRERFAGIYRLRMKLTSSPNFDDGDASFDISGSLALAASPSVVWHGADLVVAWEDQRDGNSEIYVRRFDGNGGALTEPVRLTQHAARSHAPSIAIDGQRLLIVWTDQRAGDEEGIYFRSVPASLVGVTPL